MCVYILCFVFCTFHSLLLDMLLLFPAYGKLTEYTQIYCCSWLWFPVAPVQLSIVRILIEPHVSHHPSVLPSVSINLYHPEIGISHSYRANGCILTHNGTQLVLEKCNVCLSGPDTCTVTIMWCMAAKCSSSFDIFTFIWVVQ